MTSRIPSAFGLLLGPANRCRVIASRRAVWAEIVRTDDGNWSRALQWHRKMNAAGWVGSPNHGRHRINKTPQLFFLLPDGAFGGDHIMGVHQKAVQRHNPARLVSYGCDSRLEPAILSVLAYQAVDMIVPLASASHYRPTSHDLIPIIRVDEAPPIGRGLFRCHSQIVFAVAVYIGDPPIGKGLPQKAGKPFFH